MSIFSLFLSLVSLTLYFQKAKHAFLMNGIDEVDKNGRIGCFFLSLFLLLEDTWPSEA